MLWQAFTFLVAATVIGATWVMCMLLNEISKLMSTLTRQVAVTTLDVVSVTTLIAADLISRSNLKARWLCVEYSVSSVFSYEGCF